MRKHSIVLRQIFLQIHSKQRFRLTIYMYIRSLLSKTCSSGIVFGKFNQIYPCTFKNLTIFNVFSYLNIYLSSQKEFVDNVVIQKPLGSSDHNQLHFNIKIKSDKTKVKQCRRDFRKGNYKEIRKRLAQARATSFRLRAR